jgi:N-methylhydantoinase A
MRTENRFEQYDLNLRCRRRSIPREDRFSVKGRIGAEGQELQPLDEAALVVIAETIAARRFGAVAIGFIHSYANPAHERRAREILSQRSFASRSRSAPKSRRRCASSSVSTRSAPTPMSARRWPIIWRGCRCA